MRSILRCAFIALFLVVSVSADDHQTASVEVAIGAEMEIFPRTPDLVVLEGLGPHTLLSLTPEMEEPGLRRSASADGLALGMIPDLPEQQIFLNSVYARARARAIASNNSAQATATAWPSVDLINMLDEPILLRLFVHIPGRFPEADTAVPNDYFDRGSSDDNWVEYAAAVQSVSIITSWDYDPGGEDDGFIRPLQILRETRPSLSPGPAGPGAFDHIGFPFDIEYRLPVPPSITEFDDHIEVRLHGLGLWVRAYADAFSVLDGTSKPIMFRGAPSLCELAPPRRISEVLPNLDPLCRAGRAGASRAPICDCARDDNARSQRCAFSFIDFHLVQQLPAPAFAGEQVQVEWVINPAMDGEYSFRPEILIDGKWVSVQSKEKLAGKLMSGKEARTKLAFTMPSRPTVLRTRMTHLPKGAKQPIESQIDTVIALKKSKAKP